MDKVTVSARCRTRIRSTASPTRPPVTRCPARRELNPRDPRTGRSSARWSITWTDRGKPAADGRAEVPRNLLLPWAFSSQRVGEVPRRAPTAASSGQAYDPICTEFVGEGTQKATKTLLQMKWNDLEPYRGITPESRFQLGAVSQLGRRPDARPARPAPVAAGADRGRSEAATDERRRWIDRHREMAYQLLESAEAAPGLRPRSRADATPAHLYGMTLFGQAA